MASLFVDSSLKDPEKLNVLFFPYTDRLEARVLKVKTRLLLLFFEKRIYNTVIEYILTYLFTYLYLFSCVDAEFDTDYFYVIFMV